MSSNVVQLMNELVASPEKLEQYKQDPDAYLEQTNLILSTDEKEALLDCDGYRQTSTVTATKLSSSQPSPWVDAKGAPVTFIARERGLHVDLPCSCTSGAESFISYAHDNRVVAFHLYLSYVAQDSQTCAFEMYMAESAETPSAKTSSYNLSGATVKLYSTFSGTPIMLTVNTEKAISVQPGCYYDPSTQTLYLNF